MEGRREEVEKAATKERMELSRSNKKQKRMPTEASRLAATDFQPFKEKAMAG